MVSRRCVLCRGAAALLLGPASAAPAETEVATIEMRPVQLAEGAWFVQGEAALGSAANQNFISNAGFVVTPAGVVVIDALGSPPLARRLLAEIRRITPQPIRYVIATHYHADHIYGLQVFKQAGATILAHTAAREYLASDAARQRLAASRQDLFPWVDENTRLVEPDRWLGVPDPKADTTLELGGVRLLIRPVGPAHTPEDLVVYLPDRGVLYGGDLLFRGRIPFVGQADSRAWIEALDRLLSLKPKVLVPGHGAASTDPVADITLTRDYLQYLRDRMGAAAREMEPFEEAYARTDWSRFAGLPLFQAANRINAYNTYLLMEHQGR
ncbi:MBL fold metallo-hydrolase [Ideonella sp. YS5]|uniref:MBL fold metallo-hydrolase n=1 Tax=Ideonella sp. YS5 TaxID=3453714 RepID=UPI003EEA0958